MAALTHYYGQMKHSIAGINSHEATALGEDLMVATAAGAGIGLISATTGGLDKKIHGFDIPIDGLISVALGVGGLMTHHYKYAHVMKIASIAAGGSAAVRTFEKFFRSHLHSLGIKGEFEDLGSRGIGYRGYPGQLPGYAPGPGIAYGASPQDRLVDAARYL